MEPLAIHDAVEVSVLPDDFAQLASVMNRKELNLDERECEVLREVLSQNIGIFERTIGSMIILVLLFLVSCLVARFYRIGTNRVCFGGGPPLSFSCRAFILCFLLFFPLVPVAAVIFYFWVNRKRAKEVLDEVGVNEDNLDSAISHCKALSKGSQFPDAGDPQILFETTYDWRSVLLHWHILVFFILYSLLAVVYVTWVTWKCCVHGRVRQATSHVTNSSRANGVQSTSQELAHDSVTSHREPGAMSSFRSSGALSTTEDSAVSAQRFSNLPSIQIEEEGLDNCAICCDDLASQIATKLPCGHHYHRACVTSWLSTSRHARCPLCSTPV